MDGGTVVRISEGLGWTDVGRAEGVVITFVREKNIDQHRFKKARS